MKVAYIFPPPWDPYFPSYAAALFKSSTEKAGHDYFTFDLSVALFNVVSEVDRRLWDGQCAVRWEAESSLIIKKYSSFLDSYIETILARGIDLYGIHANVYSKYLAFHLAQQIKERTPKAAVIFGGPQCFPAYEGIRILDNKYVDAICTGEGDLVWPRMLDAFSGTNSLRIDLPGIAYKQDDGTVVDCGPPEPVDDLNIISFADYGGIDFADYGDRYQISIMTSRGCINTCAFCSERPNFYRYRFRRAENIFQEVLMHVATLQRESQNRNQHQNQRSFSRKVFHFGKDVLRSIKREFFPYNTDSSFRSKFFYLRQDIIQSLRNDRSVWINFNDSLINGIPKELEKFCDLVIENGLRFRWSGMALLRKEMTRELLTKMKKAGCYHLAWGLESGCQEVLRLMHKRFFTIDSAEEVIKSVRDVGIKQSIALIVGFPGETEEMLLETMQFLRSNKKYFSSVGVQPMYICPNSLVYNKPEEFGVDSENAKDAIKWQSIDGSNTYEIRLERLKRLESVVGSKIIITDK